MIDHAMSGQIGQPAACMMENKGSSSSSGLVLGADYAGWFVSFQSLKRFVTIQPTGACG